MKKRVSIIGATGFGGLGLLEIIHRHPELEVVQIIARQDTGVPINQVFPHLLDYYNLLVEDASEVRYDDIDLVFFSTPDRAGMDIIIPFFERNIPVIDFSGDFRFQSADVYAAYAVNRGVATDHHTPGILNKSVYGLPETNYEAIQNASIIGNPGCFAISIELALLPLAKSGLLPETVICDSKSGVSGAGKNPGAANFLPQRHENINTYREGKHQHIFEVEHVLQIAAQGKKSSIMFVPQVIPASRGILSNAYCFPTKEISSSELFDMYKDFYADAPFVKVTSNSPGTAMVRGSNYCLIRPHYDDRTGTILITSVIDNLMKGQSGNAIQNANIRLGIDQKSGLDFPPTFP